MKNIKIFDKLFSHAKYSTDNQISKYINWERKNIIGNENIVFYTDLNLTDVIHHKNYNFKKYAWLLESPDVTNSSYNWIKNNYNHFDNIFTHSKDLLNLSNKFKFAPTGGCWIFHEEQQIYKKTKNISIISSNKRSLEGHKLRHNFIGKYPFIDKYGRGYKTVNNKLEGLKDYRFSVSIENTKKDYYFTEKLIDCFITGTVPIYWGCPSIGDFFNEKGMIIFDNLNENFDKVMLWLRTNGEDIYKDMKPYIEENFEKSKEYIMSEDYIWKKYINK